MMMVPDDGYVSQDTKKKAASPAAFLILNRISSTLAE